MRWLMPDALSLPPPGSPALFLDRDGVLVEEKDYLCDPESVRLIPGVTGALARARAAGYFLIGVSNQSGLGRGRFTSDQFAAVMARMTVLLRETDGGLDDFYYCPHGPDDGCRCRKPARGLLDEAAQHHRWDDGRSWVIGDKISDVDLALDASLRPALVRTGYGREQELRLGARRGVLVADDLAAAVDVILAEGSA